MAHVRGQAAAWKNPIVAAQARETDNSGAMKLVAELKPDVLSHDAKAGELRIWLKKCETYYHASNIQVARIAVQQAYLHSVTPSHICIIFALSSSK